MQWPLVRHATGLIVVVLACSRALAAADASPVTEAHGTAPSVAPVPLDPNSPLGLFNAAREATHAGRTVVALALYGRVIAQNDPLWPMARYNRGLVLETEQRLAEAVLDYQAIAQGASQRTAQNTWLDAHTRLAVCLTKLQRYPEALVAFDTLLAQPNLDTDERLEALVGRGITSETAGNDEAAEVAYSDALHLLDRLQKGQRYDDHGLGAEASFRLGDVASRRFAAVTLAFPQDLLKERLEQKCEALLSAQGRYLRSMRYGDHQTVAAAGLRIGNLYEALYDSINGLAPPSDMNREEVEIYRDEVRKRVSVLVKKAIMVYEKALAVSRKTGAEDVWVERLEHALGRLKTVYVSESDPTLNDEGRRGLTSGAETVQ